MTVLSSDAEFCASCRKELLPGMPEFESLRGACCSYECAEKIKSISSHGSKVISWIGGLSIPVGWGLILVFKDSLHLTFVWLIMALYGVFSFGFGVLTRKQAATKEGFPLTFAILGVCFVGWAIYSGHNSQIQPKLTEPESASMPTAVHAAAAPAALVIKTIDEWRAASKEDRLARTLSYASVFTGESPEVMAVGLETCLSGAIGVAPGTASSPDLEAALASQSLQKMTVVCGLMLGYKLK